MGVVGEGWLEKGSFKGPLSLVSWVENYSGFIGSHLLGWGGEGIGIRRRRVEGNMGCFKAGGRMVAGNAARVSIKEVVELENRGTRGGVMMRDKMLMR